MQNALARLSSAKRDGKKYRTDCFRSNIYSKALEQIDGVRKLSPHACRHTFASLLHSAGVDAVNIVRLMGYADYAVTANTYTHVNISEFKKSVDAI